MLRVLLVLSVYVLTSCGATEPQRGQVRSDRTWTVVDRNTGEPIPSAWISIHYFKTFPAPGHGSTACVHAESFVADENGHFELPPVGQYGAGAPVPSKPGYGLVVGKVSDDPVKREVYLVPFTGTQQEVFFNAIRGSLTGDCHSDEDHLRELPRRKYFLEQAEKLLDRSDPVQVEKFDVVKDSIERTEMRLKSNRP